MKLKSWTLVFILALATVARAATNDLTDLLQKGLFEEEANRDLTAAVANYQSLANAFDKDRQLAATAIFRLGECYRKLGKTNEAVVQYERILHDFTDQPTLVTLSQQNLAGLRQRAIGGSVTLADMDAFRAALARAQAEVAKIDALPETNRTAGIVSLYGNDKSIQTLGRELQSLNQRRNDLLTHYLPENSQVKDVEKQIQAVEEALKARTVDLRAAAHASLDAAEEAYRLKAAEAASGGGSSGTGANSTQTAELRSLAAAKRAELAQNESLLKTLQSMNNENLRKALPAIFPDSQLDNLEKELDLANRELVQLQVNYTKDHPRYLNAQEVIKSIETKIDDRINGIMLGLQAKIDAEKAYLATIEGSSPSMTTSGGGGSSESPTTDEEQREIRRIQAMIQNSPDLINAPGWSVDADNTSLSPLEAAAGKGQLMVAKYLLDHGADVNVQIGLPLFEAVKNGHKAMVELLLAHGANPNTRNFLYEAASRGFNGVVEVLLANKADVNIRGGQQPLHAAVNHGNIDLIQALISHGADVNSADYNTSNSPLHLAAQQNNTNAAKLLLASKANIEARDKDGGTPLHDAARSGSTAMVSLLLDSGASVDATNYYNTTPLFLAATSGRVDATRVLLAHKADPNHSGLINGLRLPAVYWAVQNNEVLKLLLDAGANPEGDPNSSTSPLYWAIENGRVDAVQLLLQHGANPNRPGRSSQPAPGVNPILPLAQAMRSDRTKAAIPLLLDKGADPNALVSGGYTPLMNTTDPEIGRWLLEHKADVNFQTPQGWTPLMNAHDTNFIKFLLENGAKTDLQETNGNTALHYAAGFYSSPEEVALLLEHKANPNIQNEVGNTPLDLAKAGVSGHIPYTLLDAHSGGGPPGAAVSSDNEQKIAELLTQAGGLANLPKRNRIEVRRGPNTAFTVLKDSQGRNRYSLFEVIASSYSLLSQNTSGSWFHQDGFLSDVFSENHLSFPDFKKIIIYRSTGNSAKQTEINVDLDGILNTTNCSGDTMLEWGDIVEIPEADHPVYLKWPGLSNKVIATLTSCASRQVTVKIKDETTTLKLAPRFSGGMNSNWGLTRASFMLRSVLDNSGLIRVSSDLTRVKVTRIDPATKKTTEWIVDCTNPNDSDLWLRDGDVIEVPEK